MVSINCFRLHPTQKPVQILRPLIEAFLPARWRRAGSLLRIGLDVVAAKELARRFVGIELDRTHYLTASCRLRE
jgi:adenine-specific DNA-methyltransferase